MRSDKDKEYGLNPGEFESLKAKHDRAVRDDPFVTFAESRADIERSDSAFGGLVRWDRKSSVEFKLDARGFSPRATSWGRKEINNLRIPALLPLGILGLTFYGFRVLGIYGHSGVTLLLLGILGVFTILGLCMTSLRWDIFWEVYFSSLDAAQDCSSCPECCSPKHRLEAIRRPPFKRQLSDGNPPKSLRRKRRHTSENTPRRQHY